MCHKTNIVVVPYKYPLQAPHEEMKYSNPFNELSTIEW